MSFSGELLFAICALLAFLAAVSTVSQTSPLRAAMSLLVHIIALAGLYLTLKAHFLAAIQLLKEYIASEIGVDDGELIASSKGLHLYEYAWELAKTAARMI